MRPRQKVGLPKHRRRHPDTRAVYAADALYAIAGAIDKAGKLDSDAIAEAMRGRMEGVQGVTGALLFTDRGDRRDVPYKMYKVDPEGKLVVAGL